MLLNSGVGALPKVLEAYKGEAAWLAEPTQGWKVQPPRALAQCGGILVVKYASGCYSVAPATRWSIKD